MIYRVAPMSEEWVAENIQSMAAPCSEWRRTEIDNDAVILAQEAEENRLILRQGRRYITY
jgi:hypothetical protein